MFSFSNKEEPDCLFFNDLDILIKVMRKDTVVTREGNVGIYVGHSNTRAA